MAGEKVLICGAGVAGSVLAYWLAKADFTVQVIERARVSQKAGQGIEIEEPALRVVEAMDIMDELRRIRTGEEGFQLEDEQAFILASAGFEGPVGLTGALEMMRGDLVEVLYKVANKSDKVTYDFQTTIKSLRQSDDQVIVELESRNNNTIRVETYDFVIGADGVKSKTKDLAFNMINSTSHLKSIGAYVAYFSIPTSKQDWPNSRVCNFPGHRLAWIRPVKKDSDLSSVYLIHLADDIPALRAANAANDREKQKEAFAQLYSGLGWETSRIIEGMMETDNFYSDELKQVKLNSWSKDRVALVGDAAWAPTPFTGQGNQLAIIGPYVLAQEMAKDRGPLAFKNYEQRLRDYVEGCQEIPLKGYAPYLLCPRTSLGISVLRVVFRVILMGVRFFTWTGIGRFLPTQKEEYFDLQMESQ